MQCQGEQTEQDGFAAAQRAGLCRHVAAQLQRVAQRAAEIDQVAAGQDPEALRHLVEHSANVGALDARYSVQLSGALALQDLRLGDLVKREARTTSVPRGATVADVQAASRASGHLRILVTEPGADWGVVHVRDTLTEPETAGIAHLTRPAHRMAADTPVYTALTRMRETSTQLALVTENGEVVGVVTIIDILRHLFPRSEGGRTPLAVR